MPRENFNTYGTLAVFAIGASFITSAAADDRQPADPLDGPPVVTAKSWAVADACRRQIVMRDGQVVSRSS